MHTTFEGLIKLKVLFIGFIFCDGQLYNSGTLVEICADQMWH